MTGIGDYKNALDGQSSKKDNEFKEIIKLLSMTGDTHRLSKITKSEAIKLHKMLIVDRIFFKRLTDDPEFKRLVKEGKLTDSTNISEIIEDQLNLAVSITPEDMPNLLSIISEMYSAKVRSQDSIMEKLTSNLRGTQ